MFVNLARSSALLPADLSAPSEIVHLPAFRKLGSGIETAQRFQLDLRCSLPSKSDSGLHSLKGGHSERKGSSQEGHVGAGSHAVKRNGERGVH